ncbi:MAG: lamin tail domain-containing protein [Lentisphaerae bacterium]|nr:lamin tail domain-containing protein [Lentisphaerota bacterium]
MNIALSCTGFTGLRAPARRGGGHWLCTATSLALVTTSSLAQLVLTEVHYNPAPPTVFERQLGFDDADDFEFLELANLGAAAVSLANVALLDGVVFNFATSPMQSLAPGGRAVVVNNLAGFRLRYPAVTSIAGVYSGKLGNTGDALAWRQPSGVVESCEYGDSGAWPELPDGRGWSLHRQDPTLAAASPAAWRSSLWRHGSPGSADAAPSGVVFNEILSHTDPPMVDLIELHNRGSQPVDISGWRISDDPDALDKYVIPAGTVLGRGGYWTVTESQFRGVETQIERRFGLDGARGETLYLSAVSGASVRVDDTAAFGAQFNGESFGRWPNGFGAWFPQSARSPGASNLGVRLPRLALTELQYQPSGPNPAWEFIELANLESFPVSLQAWRLTLGVEFDFPAGMQLAPGQTLVVVPFSPGLADARAHFVQAWGMPPDTAMLGVSSGRLNDAGEYVALNSPDEAPTEEPTFRPAVVEDLVFFSPSLPWPGGTAGQGQSLHRLDRRVVGTLATSWTAGVPSPGRLPVYDEDGDLLPDDWELRHFRSRAAAQGEATDADADDFPDRHEYVAGTDPLDPRSRLAVTQVAYEAADQSMQLRWDAVPAVRYVVEQALEPGGAWTPVSPVSGVATGVFRAAAATGAPVYRIRVHADEP